MCQVMAEGGFVRMGWTVWNTLKGGGTEISGEKTKILKRRGQAGSRGGCLKKEGKGARTLLQTKADLLHLVYEEICSKFYFKIHSFFQFCYNLTKSIFSKYRAALAHFLKSFYLLLGCPIQKVLRIALVFTLALFCVFGL